ncbi:SAYSvFN domain-containing protein 1 [Oryzias melastigma]|uniref:SAYSvFN domain-containing protein 1 n=1 Tax=Oryzias melastigma TaxID=30732 RepID=A0A834CHY4_ORYME|nr:SAYSvFN domain-containing protein 1 [Oryzias melastigma]XP_036066354.1 SAYSvFN domain-containing protein 1 [Oryzias melastigma]XP_036066355.1 SAYSvFN domain-containing protein 1 [Oryzias melastigma]KAF6732238.1 SAYSvFN domain-containing protein 1 [Oryzias melastigma]
MEKKLAEFRARRRAEQSKMSEAEVQSRQQTADVHDEPPQKTDDNPTAPHSQQDTVVEHHTDWLLESRLGRWLASRHLVLSNVTLLKVLLWLVLLGLFAELEFGLPFFVISLFYWIYEGLRSPAQRQPGELSAYSVFNPDCQPLLGSLTAEQLEGEMGYRPLANR